MARDHARGGGVIPVDQTVFGNGSGGSEPGNCFAACIASLLGLPVDLTPNFAAAGAEGRWSRAANAWLMGFGLSYVDLSWNGEDGKPIVLPQWVFDDWIAETQYYVAGGPAERGFEHCVVMRGRSRELAHDPHPSKAGLLAVNGIGFLVVHDPSPRAPELAKPPQVHAPWTIEQVVALNRFQRSGAIHPFTCTCGNNTVLIAGPDGWSCPRECGYTQTWAWACMAKVTDGSETGK